jgi:hypothetical protein
MHFVMHPGICGGRSSRVVRRAGTVQIGNEDARCRRKAVATLRTWDQAKPRKLSNVDQKSGVNIGSWRLPSYRWKGRGWLHSQ